MDDYIFFNTLPILELVIYLIIFIIINYFIELCFLLDDEKGIVGEALWLNYFLTTFIFLLFIFLFPKMSDASSLNISDYYKTIAGILGTVLALIVTFSGQFPKNIFLPIIQSSDQFEYKHKLNVTDLFPYPKRIQYFVSLYSATLGISILGQVIGVPIHFNALILDPLNRDLSYLTSLAIFEITFLLIPPIIISLFYLMHVITFRGRITINSRPCGAEIHLTRRFEDACIFSWDDIPGKDECKLRDLLMKTFNIKRKEKIEIKKIDGGKTIQAYIGKMRIFIKLNSDCTEAILLSEDKVMNFIVAVKNKKLNVYMCEKKATSSPIKGAIKKFYSSLVQPNLGCTSDCELPKYPLKLHTPCTLMLLDGNYEIKLIYNNLEVSNKIEVRNGEENNYLFELEDQEEEYSSKTYK